MSKIIKSLVIKKSEKEITLSNNDTQKMSKIRYFQQIFIFFFFFSWAGHYFEAVWAWIKYLSYGSKWFPVVKDIIPLAAPYGLGAIALILFVIPLIKKYKLHPIIVFILSGVLCSSIEFICAALIVLVYGHKYFWDYSSIPYNLYGYICIQTCITFAVGSVIFIYYVYPRCQKLLKSFKENQISKIFWIMFIAFCINQTLICIREFVK